MQHFYVCVLRVCVFKERREKCLMLSGSCSGTLCLISLRKAHSRNLMLVWWLASCIDLPAFAFPLQQTVLGMQAHQSCSPAGLFISSCWRSVVPSSSLYCNCSYPVSHLPSPSFVLSQHIETRSHLILFVLVIPTINTWIFSGISLVDIER